MYSEPNGSVFLLDSTLSALADPTRRAILERLGQGSATISELAEPTGMSLTGLKKHVRILEDAELVTTEKKGRTRHCRLGPKRLDERPSGSRATAATGKPASADSTRSSSDDRKRGSR